MRRVVTCMLIFLVGALWPTTSFAPEGSTMEPHPAMVAPDPNIFDVQMWNGKISLSELLPPA